MQEEEEEEVAASAVAPTAGSGQPPPTPLASLLGNAATAVVTPRERRTSGVVIPGWIQRLTTIASRKTMSKRAWAAALFLLGTLDLAASVFHLVRTSDGEQAFSLIVGPPPIQFWAALCLFTAVRAALYLPETINTLSALRGNAVDGDTMVPLHLELTCTMSAAYIPLSFVDFLLTKCWRLYSSDAASLSHVTRLTFLSARLIWYAHIEGRKFRKNDRHEIPQVMIIVCCTLLAVMTSFPVSIMRFKSELNATQELSSVSIFVVHSPAFEDPPVQRYANSVGCAFAMCSKKTATLSEGRCAGADGTDLNSFSTDKWRLLVRSVQALYELRPKQFAVEYECKDSPNSPSECFSNATDDGVDDGASKCKILFRFSFLSASKVCRYGRVAYNYARLCPARNSCENFATEMSGGWHLVYYQATDSDVVAGYSGGSSIVSLAFLRAFIQPKLKYDSRIDACSTADELGPVFKNASTPNNI